MCAENDRVGRVNCQGDSVIVGQSALAPTWLCPNIRGARGKVSSHNFVCGTCPILFFHCFRALLMRRSSGHFDHADIVSATNIACAAKVAWREVAESGFEKAA